MEINNFYLDLLMEKSNGNKKRNGYWLKSKLCFDKYLLLALKVGWIGMEITNSSLHFMIQWASENKKLEWTKIKSQASFT